MPAIRQSVERGVNRRLELEADQGSDLVRALEAASLVVPGGALIKAGRVGLGAVKGGGAARGLARAATGAKGRAGRTVRRIEEADRRLRRRVPPYDLYRGYRGLRRRLLKELAREALKTSPEAAGAVYVSAYEKWRREH